MKYLSSKPFTGGANSKAFVERWEETFGKKDPGPPAPDRIPDHACDIVENGSPCILPTKHVGRHYTEAERTAWRVSSLRRDDDNLDFLVGCKLKSRDYPCPCDGDGEESALKDRTPAFEARHAEIERHGIMAGLELRVKKAYLFHIVLTLTDEEILSLLLMFQDRRKPGVFEIP